MIKTQVSILFLKLFATAYGIYKTIKKNPTYRNGAIAGIIVLGILLFFFGGAKAGANLSPFDVLGVTRESTKKEIGSIYRRLSAETSPDRFPDNVEVEKRHLQIQRAYEM
jgi:DnaJ-class molecular chaperone